MALGELIGLATGKVVRLDGEVENRTWSIYYGDWVCVQLLSANGYWQERGSWDGLGLLEKTAKIKAVSEGGVFYYGSMDDFQRFVSYYLRVKDLEFMSDEEAEL